MLQPYQSVRQSAAFQAGKSSWPWQVAHAGCVLVWHVVARKTGSQTSRRGEGWFLLGVPRPRFVCGVCTGDLESCGISKAEIDVCGDGVYVVWQYLEACFFSARLAWQPSRWLRGGVADRP